jgi:hypothetical protein
MLDWIHANFDARIVLLMRHPGAAVESRLRFADQWDPFPLLQRYKGDSALMTGPLARYADWLTRRLTRAEALTAIWCIENIVPAAQAATNGYLVAFYEELLEQPDAEWTRVVHGLGLADVPSGDLLAKPSQQSAVALKDSRRKEAYSRSYADWRKRLSCDEHDEIDEVLKSFGVNFYSMADDRPDVRAFVQTYLAQTGDAGPISAVRSTPQA